MYECVNIIFHHFNFRTTIFDLNTVHLVWMECLRSALRRSAYPTGHRIIERIAICNAIITCMTSKCSREYKLICIDWGEYMSEFEIRKSFSALATFFGACVEFEYPHWNCGRNRHSKQQPNKCVCVCFGWCLFSSLVWNKMRWQQIQFQRTICCGARIQESFFCQVFSFSLFPSACVFWNMENYSVDLMSFDH